MAKRSPDEEKVGPGRPPRSSQFKPGQSGNPGGRPKKERSLPKLVNEALDEMVTVTEQGTAIKLSKRQLIAKQLVNSAAGGDLRALDRLVNLISKAEPDQDSLVGISPALLASFLKRHSGSGSSESGAAA